MLAADATKPEKSLSPISPGFDLSLCRVLFKQHSLVL